MILRLTTIVIGTFFISSSAYSQFSQSFDLAKQLNPAMAGMENKSSIDVYMVGSIRSYGTKFGLMGNFSGFNSKYKIGYGINRTNSNITQNNQGFVNRQLTKLSINKQIEFSDRLKLSTGVGLGLKTNIYGGGELLDENNVYNRENALLVELGTVLKGERLELGISGGYQFGLAKTPHYLNQIVFGLSASYTFGRADGLQFTPHLLVNQVGLTNQVGHSLGGTFKYRSKFILGGGISTGFYGMNDVNPYVTVGYSISNKFKVNYTYNFQKDAHFLNTTHAIGLTFLIGNK